jgi:hypothetical protein
VDWVHREGVVANPSTTSRDFGRGFSAYVLDEQEMNRVQCSTCGAHNPDGAMRCAVCDEAPSAEVEESGTRLEWIAAMPVWLRWFIALPCVAIIGAMAIRRLVFTGFDDVTTGIIFPAAIAVVIFGAAQIAAHIAPSYKKQVGLAIVFSEVAVFCSVFLNDLIFSMFDTYSPAKIGSLNFIVPLLGAAAAIVSLIVSKTLTDEPVQLLDVRVTDVGLRRGLGIALALAASAAFEAAALGVSKACYYCLPTPSANVLASFISTAIIVTLVIAYEPVRKKVATWVVAGIFLIVSAVNLGLIASVFIRYRVDDSVGESMGLQSTMLTIGTIVGTILGLYSSGPKQSQTDSTSE